MPTPEKILDEATFVAAGATHSRYDGISIALHWLIVALVLIQFALGELWGYADRPLRHQLIVAHMSFGILLSVAVVARIAWRLMAGHRVAPAAAGWIDILARIVHYLLYALLIVQAVLGYVVRWSEGEAMSFFGLLIPPPFAALGRETHHMLLDIHDFVGWTIIIVALGHAAGALYHHFGLRDDVLVRMLPRGRARLGAKAR
jgi:cytochrome b561